MFSWHAGACSAWNQGGRGREGERGREREREGVVKFAKTKGMTKKFGTVRIFAEQNNIVIERYWNHSFFNFNCNVFLSMSNDCTLIIRTHF